MTTDLARPPIPARPGRVRKVALVVALVVLAFQLAAIPYSFTRQAQRQFDVDINDSYTTHVGPAKLSWVYLWVGDLKGTNPAANGPDTPETLYRFAGAMYRHQPNFFLVISVFGAWPLGLNLVAAGWLGRRGIATAWRRRPRLPKVRLHLTIERRPRLT